MPDGVGFTVTEPKKRPQLQVINSDLPATARELRDLFSTGSAFYDRGGILVKLARPADGGPPVAIEVTPNTVVHETHRLCQPVEFKNDAMRPVTLPERVAKMLLDMRGEWHLPALDGITLAPVLRSDGTITDCDGYDPASRLWCAKVPATKIPARPSQAMAAASLNRLRETFRTFPFGDAPRVAATSSVPSLVDTSQPAKLDETAALAGLMTAVCRPSLHLAPGLLSTAAPISGAGAGKGLLVRAIGLIAFGVQPRAFTAGAERTELDKRLAAELIEATPMLFLDNVNNVSLRSDLLARVLTERPARVRWMGKSLMVSLNSTAFIAITGNGLSVSEDLARRFLSSHLDPQLEDPESRPFAPGFLDGILSRRAELLTDVLTIWRWGRQNPSELKRGKKLGSFETWTEWVRDPLLTLGCADPVDRILEAKASDPARKRVTDLFETWHEHHVTAGRAVKDLHDDVRGLADPQGRGRQFLSAYLDKLTNTRAAGFMLTQSKPAGKWGTTTYALKITDPEGVAARTEARRKAESSAETSQSAPPEDGRYENGHWIQ